MADTKLDELQDPLARVNAFHHKIFVFFSLLLTEEISSIEWTVEFLNPSSLFVSVLMRTRTACWFFTGYEKELRIRKMYTLCSS